MKLRYLLSLGIIFSLLSILTGCECVSWHPIKQNVFVSPQKDTIHIGDTLRFASSIETSYTEAEKNVDISDREIDIFCHLNKYQNDNIFYHGGGIDNFKFNLKKGTIRDTATLHGEGGEKKQFYYELSDGKFEFEIEIIPEDTGSYILELSSTPNIKNGSMHCEQNFGVVYFFEISDEHKLNDYLLLDTTGTNKNSFYAFVVEE